MDINSILNDYTIIKECSYKGEQYSVRDNGAVFRHERIEKRLRKEDNIWTFGKPNPYTGYMEIGTERVHRIVAFAFLGEPPSTQHIVDHIDTNRRNNRPQNLRWLTKFENALNNPITRKKIEYLCGNLETFINDPSIIRKFANNNPNFEWMRTVTQEEAKVSYEKLCLWAETKVRNNSSSGTLGDWIYAPTRKQYGFANGRTSSKPKAISDSSTDNLTESLTPNAMQRNWRTPTEFPLCPSKIGDNPLTAYLNNLKLNNIVTKNLNTTHYVNDFALCDDNRLLISTYGYEGVKQFSMITVTFEEGKYVHEGRMYFEEQGAQKALILAQGLEWNGEDGIDDYT